MGECKVRKAIRISQSGTMVSLLFVIKFTPNGHILSVKLRLRFEARNVCHIHYQRNRCSEKKKKTPSVCTLFYQLNNYTGCDIKLMLELVP